MRDSDVCIDSINLSIRCRKSCRGCKRPMYLVYKEPYSANLATFFFCKAKEKEGGLRVPLVWEGCPAGAGYQQDRAKVINYVSFLSYWIGNNIKADNLKNPPAYKTGTKIGMRSGNALRTVDRKAAPFYKPAGVSEENGSWLAHRARVATSSIKVKFSSWRKVSIHVSQIAFVFVLIRTEAQGRC